MGVSTIKVGYPKYIAQENGDFNNVHAWTYGYLLKRISEVAEEYGVTVIYVDEAYKSSKCPLHGDNCGKRIKRGLFKCTMLNKVFNADLVGAYNILITPSLARGRGNGQETRPRIEPPAWGDVILNLPTLVRTLALQDGKEIGFPSSWRDISKTMPSPSPSDLVTGIPPVRIPINPVE